MIRDRDYILDKYGNYLKVVGDYHPQNAIISYVKYFPDRFGQRKITKKNYGYNSFVSKSFAILSNNKNRATFSSFHGGILTCTPKNEILKHFSCRKKIKELKVQKKQTYSLTVEKALKKILDNISNEDLDCLGITGSFLIDCYNEKSDIDLVCYGEKGIKLAESIFSSNLILPYTGSLAKNLYNRRMIHLAAVEFDKLLKQEQRKFQGVTRDGLIHINCQPLREDKDELFKNIKMIEVGEISCMAKVVDDKAGKFSPAFYSIKVLDIIDSLFSSHSIKNQIKYFISFIGVYSGCFQAGERIYLEGKLVQIILNGEMCYGIELSPWNTSRHFKAILLD